MNPPKKEKKMNVWAANEWMNKERNKKWMKEYNLYSGKQIR